MPPTPTCDSYMGDMPWLSVPFDGKTRGTIAQLLGVSALPTLLVFDEEQQLITANGRQEIIKDQKAENFPWYPKVRCCCCGGFCCCCLLRSSRLPYVCTTLVVSLW